MENKEVKLRFETFLSQLAETNATLDFFCDFDKIGRNVNSLSIKLNQLNYLIGKEDMNSAIRDLWDENPKVFSILNILIAVRNDTKKVIDGNDVIRPIGDFFKSPESVAEYIDKTGLKEVLQNKQIKNLVDYVFGIETGLDSNARKNRTGDIMGNRVEKAFRDRGISFRREVYSTEFNESACLGSDTKRFDFVVETGVKTFLIEVNFYSGGGSKLNEVARSYSELAPKINSLQDYEFVWITDGIGWLNARNKLEESFSVIPRIYNLTTIHEFMSELLRLQSTHNRH